MINEKYIVQGKKPILVDRLQEAMHASGAELDAPVHEAINEAIPVEGDGLPSEGAQPFASHLSPARTRDPNRKASRPSAVAVLSRMSMGQDPSGSETGDEDSLPK
jgi:hypothetical protein